MKIVASPYAALLARTPQTESTVVVDGRQVAVWEYGTAGDGPTLLFVHGFRGDHHGLEPVVAHLPGVHIVAPDLPGFGSSAPLAGEHSIAGYARWLGDFMASAGLGSDTIVLGHSFGSIIVAAALAGGLPAASAILVNPIAAPALAGPNPLGTRIASAYYRAGGVLPARLGQPLLTSQGIVRVLSEFMAKTKDKGLRRWIHSQHARFFSDYAERRVVLEAFTASITHDITEFADGITIPVHLIAAEHDDITAVKDVEALAAKTGWGVDVIPDVGHLIHYETPDQAAAIIGRVAGVPAV